MSQVSYWWFFGVFFFNAKNGSQWGQCWANSIIKKQHVSSFIFSRCNKYCKHLSHSTSSKHSRLQRATSLFGGYQHNICCYFIRVFLQTCRKFETEFINTFSPTANAELWLGDVKYSARVREQRTQVGKAVKAARRLQSRVWVTAASARLGRLGVRWRHFNISPGKAAAPRRVTLCIIHHHPPHPPLGDTHTLMPQKATEPRAFVTR